MATQTKLLGLCRMNAEYMGRQLRAKRQVREGLRPRRPPMLQGSVANHVRYCPSGTFVSGIEEHNMLESTLRRVLGIVAVFVASAQHAGHAGGDRARVACQQVTASESAGGSRLGRSGQS
jgi:hypothetical protein